MNSVLKKKQNLFDMISENMPLFVAYFCLIVALFTTVFYFMGLLPDELMPEERIAQQVETQDVVPVSELENDNPPQAVSAASSEPVTRIMIDKVGIDSIIGHPATPDVATLDAYLTKGAVYYPGSGTPEQGNIFIFGHSTNWAIVQNPAYRTFNGLEKLKNGDEIVLQSASKTYKYRVTSVKLVDDDEAFVEFNSSTPMLTISTCNTFGEKQERHVVEAVLIS